MGASGCTCVRHQQALPFLAASGLRCQLLNMLPTDLPAARSQGSLSLRPFLCLQDYHPQISSGPETGHHGKAA